MDRTIRIVFLLLLGGILLAAGQIGRSLQARVGSAWTGLPVFENGTVGPTILVSPRLGDGPRELRPQDRVVSVNGQAISDGRELTRRVALISPGTQVRYGFERPDGKAFEIGLTLLRLRESDVLGLYVPFLVVGLLLAGCGIATVLVRPDLSASRALAVAAGGSGTFFLVFVPGFFLSRDLPSLAFFSLALPVGGVFHLALEYPVRRWPLTRFPRTAVGLIYAVALAYAAGFAMTIDAPGPILRGLGTSLPAVLVAGGTLLSVNLFLAARHSSNPNVRGQAGVILAAMALVGLDGAALALHTWSAWKIDFPPALWLLPVFLLAAAPMYAIVGYEAFGFPAIARRALTICTLVISALILFLASFALVDVWAGAAPAWAFSTVLVVVLTVLLPVIRPLQARIEHAVEGLFFPGLREAHALISETCGELGRLRDADSLMRYLRERLQHAVGAETVRVLIAKPGEPARELSVPPGKTPIEVQPAEPLYRACVSSGPAASLGRAGRSAIAREAFRENCRRFGAELAVPLPASERLAGAMLLGRRTDGSTYTPRDRQLVELVAGPLAIAIENATVLRDIRTLEEALRGLSAPAKAVPLSSPHFESDHAEIVGRSAEIRHVIAQAERVGPTDATVLVVGETGTGKELVVRAIHAASNRIDRPLVTLACAAIPRELLESELFGHEQGAFTGARSRKMGQFEYAHQGTIFLDDVDTLPLELQAKLLRVIQEGEVQRLGANEPEKCDVRVIAATNRDLAEEVRQGRFREDLFYRLNVVPILIPPLRERREDIPRIAEQIVRQEATKVGRVVESISAEAMAELRGYAWPGNVRQLRNTLQRALILTEGPVLTLAGPLGDDPGVPREGVPASEADLAEETLGNAPLADLIKDYKVSLIERALRLSGGNQTRAAEILGMHRSSLTRMIRQLGLERR